MVLFVGKYVCAKFCSDMPLESIKKSLSFVKGKVFVVSVLGPQSSGKSTVLNFLFGCNFRASEGRCTKGVYGSYYQINSSQIIIGYHGLLIIDTEGINSQSKNKQFDRQLVSFIMSISDIVLVTMKGDLDKAVGDLLTLCYRNTKKRFYNPNIKFILILNQNNTSDITKNEKQINDFKKRIQISGQIQLARAFSGLTIGSQLLPFLNQKKDFVKFTPLNAFMEQIIDLQTQVIQIINYSTSSQTSTIDRKMQIFSKNWEIVRSFSRIYRYDTNQQIELATRMDQWMVEAINDFQKKQVDLEASVKIKQMTIKYAQQQQKVLREDFKQTCLNKMVTLAGDIITEFMDQIDKPDIAKLSLQEFIKTNLTKRYYKIIDEYENIFLKKIEKFEQEQAIINVEEQGLIKITSEAYKLRNLQLQTNKLLSEDEINNKFQELWDQSVAELKNKLDNTQSFSTINELTKKQYNIQKQKIQKMKQVDQSQIKDLPKQIDTINQKNIKNKNVIFTIFQKLLYEKKNNLLERSDKDPIFIYDNVGITTAAKKYLNIQNAYLTKQKARVMIGFEKSGLEAIITAQMVQQLKYEGLRKSINKQLQTFGIEVVNSVNLKNVIEYEQKPYNSAALTIKPLLEINFISPKAGLQNHPQVFELIINGNISKIKKKANKTISGGQLLSFKNIQKHMQNYLEDKYMEDTLNNQLNSINLNCKINRSQKAIKFQISFTKRNEISSVEEFKKKIQNMILLGRPLAILAKFQQNLSQASHFILGGYQIDKYVVNKNKKLTQQVVEYFTSYVSTDNKDKIYKVKTQSLDIALKTDFISGIFNQIKIKAQELLKQTQRKQKMRDLGLLVVEQFKIFDEDYRQLSLKSTQVFKGYCHLYATYLLVSDQMIKQSEQNLAVITNYQKLKKNQKNQFLNRASYNHQKSSLGAFHKVRQIIDKFFQAQASNSKKSGFKLFSSDQKLRNLDYLKIKLPDLLNKCNTEIMKCSQDQVINYTLNKYTMLKKVKQSELSQIVNNYHLINVYARSYLKQLQKLRSAISFLELVFDKARIEVKKKQKLFYDEKNFFKEKKLDQKTGARLYKYFIKVVELAGQLDDKKRKQQLEEYQKSEYISKQLVIRIEAVQVQKDAGAFKKILKLLQDQVVEISNLYYFLFSDKQTVLISTAIYEEAVKGQAHLKKQMSQLLKERIDFKFCQAEGLCPCCSQICFQEDNHTTHRADHHQTRGWGKTVTTRTEKIDSKSYLSTITCQEVNDSDPMYYNGSKRTWKQYKDDISKFWAFPEKQSINKQLKKTQNAHWNTYGPRFAQIQNRLFRKAQHNTQYHLIFIIDDSGSMAQEWSSMRAFYDKTINTIKTNPKNSFKLDNSNTVITQILFSVQARQIYKQIKPDQVGKFPQFNKGERTNFLPAFQAMEKAAEQETIIRSKTVFFFTDGGNHDYDTFKDYAKHWLNRFLITNNINLIAIFFGQDQFFFWRAFADVNCKKYCSNDISQINQIVQSQIEGLVSK